MALNATARGGGRVVEQRLATVLTESTLKGYRVQVTSTLALPERTFDTWNPQYCCNTGKQAFAAPVEIMQDQCTFSKCFGPSFEITSHDHPLATIF